jgi:nicotinamidase-related amidase
MNEALILIDIQEDLFSDPKNRIYNETGFIININRLIEHFREENKTIIFIRHADEELIPGTLAWQIYSGIKSEPEDLYIEKTTPDSFFKTDLLRTLTELKIDSILIAGLQTDCCIDTTCRSAFGKDIKTVLVSDAHSTYDNSFMKADKIIEYHNKIIGRWFAKLKTTNEIINNSGSMR